MKKLLLLLSIVFVSKANAQLTNAQVYNFGMGDLFQVTYAGAAGPAPIVTDSVMNKFYSSGLDTLYYVMSRSTYSPAFPPNPAVLNYSIDTMVITDLALPAEHFVYTYTCLPASDTTLTNSCGNTFERFHSNFDSTCFEPQNWYSDLYAGLGGPYYYVYDPVLFGTNMEWYSKTLTYYNSNQFGECGTYQSFVGIEELNASIEVNVYPNPATNKLHVTVKANEYSYSIFALSGNLIEANGILGEEHTIDISHLNPGNYFIKVSVDSSVKTLPFVKK